MAASITASPQTTPCQISPSSRVGSSTAPPTAQNSADPAKPSQDFFGLTVGAIGCLPNSTPAT